MAIDKKAFLARIANKAPSYASDAMPGEGSAPEEAGETPKEESSEDKMSCGEQLMHAIDNKDPVAIDAALKEAVRKYSGG